MNKTIIERNFSRYAHLYDSYAGLQTETAWQLLAETNGFKPKEILELGCGTGNYTLLLRKKFKNAKIYAVDISQRMLQVAEKKLQDEAVKFILSDAEELNLEKEFCLITSNASFQWFENLEKALSLYRRHLKKRGRITFSIFTKETFPELREVLKSIIPKSSIASDFFISEDKINSALRKNFANFKMKEKKYTEKFKTLNDFLCKIKYTGTRGAGFVQGITFDRPLLRKMEGLYLEKFGQIKATYQVFFCEARV